MATEHAHEPTTAATGLAARLDRLFTTMRPSPDREYTHEEVAQAIGTSGGPSISATYVWQLRTGRRDNPTKRHLEALAGFFGVAPAYFFDDDRADEVDRQLALVAAMRDTGVRSVALRASGLSPQSIEALLLMVERVRELEGVHRSTQGDTRDDRLPEPG